ncbi:flagellar export protein FliJ [Cohnella pontilimi]|uniref:Flagellar FliJ protein n=1 Tax=Cohnella pontilimi TaxID=2564100 RepID=A0A4U0FEG2_9BACL|nr:flagellar export protein FliJ [Cohnella pontilimi]TJY43188.1 flagellar export protein FliJ [Cohnella pontilimi]
MRFRYPLQKIVDLKGSEKSLAEWEYAASLGLLREQEERLDHLFRERRETEERLSRTAAAPVALAELTALQQYLDMLDGQIRRQLEEVRNAEGQVRLKQSRLAEKSVDEKVWLKARDKAYQRYRHEWLAREQNELDEMAIVRSAASRG